MFFSPFFPELSSKRAVMKTLTSRLSRNARFSPDSYWNKKEKITVSKNLIYSRLIPK